MPVNYFESDVGIIEQAENGAHWKSESETTRLGVGCIFVSHSDRIRIINGVSRKAKRKGENNEKMITIELGGQQSTPSKKKEKRKHNKKERASAIICLCKELNIGNFT